MVTSLLSPLNPIFFFETSFAIIKSQCFSSNFLREFPYKFSVSAEKPTNNLGLYLLFLPRKLRTSTFPLIFISFRFLYFLILFSFFDNGLKSDTAAAHTAI